MAGCLAIFERSLLEFLLITLFVAMLKKKVGSKATTTLLPFPLRCFSNASLPLTSLTQNYANAVNLEQFGLYDLVGINDHNAFLKLF